MLGRAAVAMWWNATAEMRDEIEDWHTHEHMPERLSIPGFLRGTRWRALDGSPSYFILYEVARASVLTGTHYMARLNDPTPWSRKMMPHHLDMVRSLCRLQASAGGLGGVLATLRFSPPRRGARELERVLAQEMLLPVTQRKGIAGGCLLRAQPQSAPQTTEQQIRGQDGTANCVALVSGYDARATAAAADEISAGLAARGAVVESDRAIFTLAYSLAAKDG